MAKVSTDMVGQVVSVGDTIIYNPPRLSGVAFGKITKVMPKSVEINGVFRRNLSDVLALNEPQLLGVAQKRLAGEID